MRRKLLGDLAALLQSPIKWYNEKKSSRKERLGDDDDDELMLNVLRCHLTY